MRIHTLVGVVAAIISFALGYVPPKAAITIFVLVGTTVGVVFIKAHDWAIRGLVGPRFLLAPEKKFEPILDSPTSDPGSESPFSLEGEG